MKDRDDVVIELIPQNTKTILDFGCGDFHLTNKLNKNGYLVYGVDLNTDLKIENIRDNTMDCVISVCVMEHTINTGLYLQHVKRVLKNDGTFIVCIPCGINFNTIISQLFINHKRLKADKFTSIEHDHVKLWNAKTFNTLMKRMGFEYDVHVLQGGCSIGKKLHIPLLGLSYTMIFRYKIDGHV